MNAAAKRLFTIANLPLLGVAWLCTLYLVLFPVTVVAVLLLLPSYILTGRFAEIPEKIMDSSLGVPHGLTRYWDWLMEPPKPKAPPRPTLDVFAMETVEQKTDRLERELEVGRYEKPIVLPQPVNMYKSQHRYAQPGKPVSGWRHTPAAWPYDTRVRACTCTMSMGLGTCPFCRSYTDEVRRDHYSPSHQPPCYCRFCSPWEYYR